MMSLIAILAVSAVVAPPSLSWEKVRETVHAAGKHVMVPGGFGFEGADAVFRDMDLMMLRSAAVG